MLKLRRIGCISVFSAPKKGKRGSSFWTVLDDLDLSLPGVQVNIAMSARPGLHISSIVIWMLRKGVCSALLLFLRREDSKLVRVQVATHVCCLRYVRNLYRSTMYISKNPTDKSRVLDLRIDAR